MKKFAFQLETVMNYKNQRLESKRNEHGQAIAKVNKQKEKMAEIARKYNEVNVEFNNKKQRGIRIVEAMEYSGFLQKLDAQLKQEEASLAEMKKLEEKKRVEMVEVKIETSTLEKLKEKKFNQYKKDMQKSEELFIEEFITRKWI
ncbi:MAG TPA: flagellar export protein FliJ [Lachnospiraceae bacterium]|nr:flagellar export protein FliJ [Lachnospiraceae bacterium]